MCSYRAEPTEDSSPSKPRRRVLWEPPPELSSVAALEGAAAINLTHPQNLCLVLLSIKVFC